MSLVCPWQILMIKEAVELYLNVIGFIYRLLKSHLKLFNIFL